MNKSALANLLVRTNAFAPFRYLNRDKLLILMYHRFSESEEFGKTSRRTFERHLEYLTRHYRILPLSQAVDRVRNGNKFPPRSAVITVDDGYRDFYQIAFPILQKFNVAATIYVVTDFVDRKRWIWTDIARYILLQTGRSRLVFSINDRAFDVELRDRNSRLMTAGSLNSELKKLPDVEKDEVLQVLARAMSVDVPDIPAQEYSAMNWDEARLLTSSNIEVGSHTVSHPILTNIDPDRLERELSSSKKVIEDQLRRETAHFCYPNGNFSERERRAVQAAGYASAVTTEIRLCGPHDDSFTLPRIDAEPQMHRFVQSTSGFDKLKR